jgi:hypothetical protein
MPEWIDVSDDRPRIAYTATSGQVDFAIPFVFFEDADILFYQNGTLKTLTTHYTVTGEENENGGTASLVTAASAGDEIVIVREIGLDLTTHQSAGGPLDIPALNLQTSRIIAMIQQVNEARPRSLRQPDEDADDLDELPEASDRALKYLYFDADGQPTLVAAVSTIVAATAFIQTLLDDATAAEARTTLGIQDQASYTGLANWHLCR